MGEDWWTSLQFGLRQPCANKSSYAGEGRTTCWIWVLMHDWVPDDLHVPSGKNTVRLKNSINTSPTMWNLMLSKNWDGLSHPACKASSFLPVHVPLLACNAHRHSAGCEPAWPSDLDCRIFLCTIGSSCWLWPIVVLCSCSPRSASYRGRVVIWHR